MIELNKIYNEDCLEGMKHIPDKSIDLTVTSPPYDNLRSYNGNNKMWNDDVWKSTIKELYRVTKEGGVVVWVVNDAKIKGSKTLTSFKQALFFKESGFNVHDVMIWKKTTFNAPKPNVYHQVTEFMFVLSKGKPKTFNPIKDRKNKHFGKTVKPTIREPDGTTSKRSAKTIKEYGKRFNVWEVTEVKNSKEKSHPAMFPEKLAHDHIISWSNEDDVILDPFAGSGTTAIAALNTGRDFIGFELDEEYHAIANERIAKHVSEKGATT